jgi:hypothetical protein
VNLMKSNSLPRRFYNPELASDKSAIVILTFLQFTHYVITSRNFVASTCLLVCPSYAYRG